nr:MAG TPA: hypothetical protein [Caudoviricetes sp.]
MYNIILICIKTNRLVNQTNYTICYIYFCNL